MTQPNTALSTAVAEREVSFIPFGVDERDPNNAIRLSVALIKGFIANKTRTGAICDDAQAMKFVMLCKARRLNPWEGDAFLVGFDSQKDGPQFSLVTAHQAFLKRAEVHPEFDGMESGVLVRNADKSLEELQGDFYTSDQTLVGGWARVHFKTRKWPMYKKLRLEDFRKPYGVWNTNPGGMIVKCAEADALRSSFPTMMGGMYLREEVEAQVVTSEALPATQSRLLNRPQPALPPSSNASADAGAPSGAGSHGLAPAATPRRGRPPKVAAEPSVTAPAGEPAPLPAPRREPEPEPPTDGGEDPFAGGERPAGEGQALQQIQPIETHDDPAECTTRIRNALRALNMSEQTLVEWCRGKDMMNEKQNFISLMNTSKLHSICERWPDIVAEMRASA